MELAVEPVAPSHHVVQGLYLKIAGAGVNRNTELPVNGEAVPSRSSTDSSRITVCNIEDHRIPLVGSHRVRVEPRTCVGCCS